ncbi:RimJ/RimL family protein N-acetyltransferase [Croceifilum oryzae]|uniref:RimJ/RimL family protein N-acetyltransferase n=1 Tax=Croceifilum oryzae TaxID=1553429 RepID=A0AAJ1TDI3_9BACL|nr:GNAT family protein [Croceifilum oryzae]MDQ0416534.1 RimJ/RimL family protein N-acetyltransferase [Croceifilum oryzae]
MSDHKVVLSGNKVELKDISLEYVEKIYYWRYLAENREHLNWNAPYHPIDEKSLEEFIEEDYRSHLDITTTNHVRSKLAIIVNNKLIGTVGWYWVDQNTNWLDSGIVIFDPDFWSGGYGTEAFKMWVDYLFENMDIVRVGISTWSGNERMIGLAKKVGMIQEGRIRNVRIVEGKYFDSVKMGILREEWIEFNK